jgi:hypothetical protein
MAFWFGKKKPAELREVTLPGEVGTISFPVDFTVEMENERTLLAYPKGENAVSLRASSMSIARKDGNVQTAGKIAVKEHAEKKRHQYYEIGDKGLLSRHASRLLGSRPSRADLVSAAFPSRVPPPSGRKSCRLRSGSDLPNHRRAG